MVESILHKKMPFTIGGQTVVDRVHSVRTTLTGSELAKIVCKATTEEVLYPKRKHLNYLLACSGDEQISIVHLTNLLVERMANSNWCVAFKALITIHTLMRDGNERFLAYLAFRNVRLLVGSIDNSTVLAHDMRDYVRKYANYLSEKVASYRALDGKDLCKVDRQKSGFRQMPLEELVQAVPVLEGQLEALLDFDASADELTNDVIRSAFFLLLRDLVRLYASYNDAVTNLLGVFFELEKRECREALEMYKRFLARVVNVGDFFGIADALGVARSTALARLPNTLVEVLEAHLAELESKNKGFVEEEITGPAVLPDGQSNVSLTSNPFVARTNAHEGVLIVLDSLDQTATSNHRQLAVNQLVDPWEAILDEAAIEQ